MAEENDRERVANEVLRKHAGFKLFRACAYCNAGYRRHTSNAPGHWHTIVVKCWDQLDDKCARAAEESKDE